MSLSGRAGAKAVLVEADDRGLPFGVVAAKIRPPAPRPGRLENGARQPAASGPVRPGGLGRRARRVRQDHAARPMGRRATIARFAWVSLDRRDNDPVVLLAARRGGDQRDRAGRPTRRSTRSPPPGASIWSTGPPRVAAMVAAADECVLVLDDAHDGDRKRLRRGAGAPGRPRPGRLDSSSLSSRVESALVTKLRSADAQLLEIGANGPRAHAPRGRAAPTQRRRTPLGRGASPTLIEQDRGLGRPRSIWRRCR